MQRLSVVSNVWSWCYWRLKAYVSSLKQRAVWVWVSFAETYADPLETKEEDGADTPSVVHQKLVGHQMHVFVVSFWWSFFFSWCDLLLLISSLLIHASSSHRDSSDWLMFNLQSQTQEWGVSHVFSRRLSHSLHAYQHQDVTWRPPDPQLLMPHHSSLSSHVFVWGEWDNDDDW